MRRFSAIVVAIILVASAVNPVSAKTLGEEQAGLISTNCASIKLQLQTVEKYGSKSRQHLGAQYESILTNLIMNLNLRLVKNNRASAEITEQQSKLSSERENFKSRFTDYSRDLESLKNMDCKSDPQAFYDKLRTVRDKRNEISNSMQRIREIVGEHRESVSKLREELKNGQ
jgi:hypothetical protein